MNKCPKCGESPWGDAGFQTELPEQDGEILWQQVKRLKCGFGNMGKFALVPQRGQPLPDRF